MTKIDNHYNIFRIGHKEAKDLQCEVYYVADGPANGRNLAPGKDPKFQHDQPIRIPKSLDGLIGLAHELFKAHQNYLKDINIVDTAESPYFGFSFEPPYQIAMWDDRVWCAEKLSNKEKIDFLKEMQKNYISPPKA
ncbi:MAG: hypothetical protein K8R02_07800 [Anaerohalosphaeraceae bacterium]|nr:hypothetical protein [Anaerohalosphaeraceae bacterium]